MATSEGFTEGEWTVNNRPGMWKTVWAGDEPIGVAYGGDGEPWEDGNPSQAEAEANARLWAASKKLLAVVQEYLTYITYIITTPEIRARGEAAIAAALGQEEAAS